MSTRLALVPLVCAVAAAQEPAVKRIDARVTAVSGAGVYLDVGSDAGVEPGDRARVYGAGGATLELVVRAVTRQSARCELVSGAGAAEPGAQAEVLVPEVRTSTSEPTQAPVWSSPEGPWDPSQPLLAPAKVPTPAERASRFRGRWYTSLDTTFDRSGDEQRYMLARTGFDGEWENLTGRGDVLRFDGEYFYRASEDGNSTDESLSRGRIDRLSWRLGDWRDHPSRLELGRFMHSELPQLGVVDGVEYVRRTESGSRWGASVGLLPVWDATLETGDDLQTSLFYRYIGGQEGELTAGAALQKTWHEGESDRDALLGDFAWRPSERWWLAGSAWFDWYDSSDTPKSSGVELTELHLNAQYRPAKEWGLGASLSHMRWPVMLRNDLPPTTLATLADGQVDRASFNGWRDLSRDVRLSGRLDAWSTQDDDGFGGELRAAWRDLVWEQGELACALFGTSGEFSSVAGVRLGASRWSSAGNWTLAYEAAQHEQDAVTGDLGSLLQQTVRGSWDFALGRWWSCALTGELYFGDEQDAAALGVWLQRRF